MRNATFDQPLNDILVAHSSDETRALASNDMSGQAMMDLDRPRTQDANDLVFGVPTELGGDGARFRLAAHWPPRSPSYFDHCLETNGPSLGRSLV